MKRWDEAGPPEWRMQGSHDWMVMRLLQELTNCAELLIGQVDEVDPAEYSEENMEILKNVERIIMRVLGEFVLWQTKALTEAPHLWDAFERWCELNDLIRRECKQLEKDKNGATINHPPHHIQSLVRERATIEVDIGGCVALEWPHFWEPFQKQGDVDLDADTEGG